MENWVFNQIPPGLFKKNEMSYHLSFSICWAKSDLTDIPSKVIVFKLKVVNARRSGVNYPGTRLFSGEKRRITGEKKIGRREGKGLLNPPLFPPLFVLFPHWGAFSLPSSRFCLVTYRSWRGTFRDETKTAARETKEPGARFSNVPVALRARSKIFRSKSKKSMVPS